MIRRDLTSDLPQLTENCPPPVDDRGTVQHDTLALSDKLVSELQKVDTIVIGAPIYNVSVPAYLKAWIDLVTRAGLTFQYIETGPKGLLEGKRAIVALASGGTPVGSDADFATGYLRHVLGFIGITDVQFVAAGLRVRYILATHTRCPRLNLSIFSKKKHQRHKATQCFFLP